jgi:hypothetical protein
MGIILLIYGPQIVQWGAFVLLGEVAFPDAVRYSTAMEPRGLYRERIGWGDKHSARVRYDEHQELDMSESRYRERGYKSPFETENDV